MKTRAHPPASFPPSASGLRRSAAGHGTTSNSSPSSPETADAAATPWTLPSLVLAGVVTASGAAGFVHLAVIGEHWRTYRPAGIFFALLGAFQVIWAALVARRPTRLLYAAGAAANVATIAVWTVSRTVGLPFGPSRGIPGSVGVPDVLSTVFEELVVIGLVVLARSGHDRTPLTLRTYRAGLALAAAVAVPGTLWALAAIHGGSPFVPPAPAGNGAMAGDLALMAGAGQAAAAVVLLLYLTAVARTGKPSPGRLLAHTVSVAGGTPRDRPSSGATPDRYPSPRPEQTQMPRSTSERRESEARRPRALGALPGGCPGNGSRFHKLSSLHPTSARYQLGRTGAGVPEAVRAPLQLHRTIHGASLPALSADAPTADEEERRR